METELEIHFQLFGSIAPNVLQKCVQICNTYNVDAEDLADHWAAYSASNSIDGVPTLQELENLERKIFLKPQRNVSFKQTKNLSVAEASRQDLIDHDTLGSTSTQIIQDQVNRSTCSINGDQIGIKSVNSNLSGQSSNTASGSTLKMFGLPKRLKKASFKRNENEKLALVALLSEYDHLKTDARYMYETMVEKTAYLTQTCDWIGNILIDKFKLEEPKPITKALGATTIYGRIKCDADGTLNAASVLLEGSQELNKGKCIHLNLSQVNYTLFPGQIIVAEGYNTSDHLLVKQIYSDASCVMSTGNQTALDFKEPLQIVIAAGPFTSQNDSNYKPLLDLLTRVKENSPHVLILVGPFIDEDHDNIKSNSCNQTYGVCFSSIIDIIVEAFEGKNTQIVFVASNRDINHHVVFPTPPYVISHQKLNIHSVADPSILNIDGLTVGLTSIDVLYHLSKEEICSLQGDPINRLVSYLFEQQSFYPLCPPSEDLAVDYRLLDKHGILNIIPNILIVPSQLQYFIKKIKGCVVINPEYLVKNNGEGTFCQVEVWLPEENESITDCINAKIIRI